MAINYQDFAKYKALQIGKKVKGQKITKKATNCNIRKRSLIYYFLLGIEVI